MFILTALFLLAYISLCAFIAIRQKRADLADIAWGLGFFLVAWISFFLSPNTLYSFIVNFLITAWAFRLAIHIYLRNRNRKEDFRYEKLKEQWGQKNISLRMFLQVFLLQGVILYIVALPLIWINTHPHELTLTTLCWVVPIWLAGFLIETIGDYQLLKFLKDPSKKGQLLTTGLWSYVRHPNYLGEITQWWAIWALTLFLPLLISPLLITFLIVKVSGIAPLEKKMQNHPDFPEYARNTPSLIPTSFPNALLFALAWFIIISFGTRDILFPVLTFLLTYALQIYLFAKREPKSLLIAIPLSIYALIFGLILETLFIHFNLLLYPQHDLFPPFWILSLYPLFALTLNSSLFILNYNLFLPFFFGGIGALFSYHFGQKFAAVLLFSPFANPIVFISCGLSLTILILLNRKLIALREKYTAPQRINQTLTVFFDPNCPVCSREMDALKNRAQTGKINYACPKSENELEKITTRFTYKEAMEKIHAIDANGKILTGTDVLSELYARTNLPLIAIWLQAPLFRPIFIFVYAIWAKLRRSI